MSAEWEKKVSCVFKEHVRREKVANEASKQRAHEERKRQKREILELRESNALLELKLEILRRHPDALQLEYYAQFLRDVTRSMENTHSYKGRIVRDVDGREREGHVVERKLLGRPVVKPRQAVPVLRKGISEEAKADVFEDLVRFYSHDRIQSGDHEQREGCFLECFAKTTLMEGLGRSGFAIRDVRIASFCGTPLDINFGVDAALIIEGDDGEKVHVYIDLKTCPARSNMNEHDFKKGRFADVALVVESDGGEIVMNSQCNIQNVIRAVFNCIETYRQKHAEKIAQ